MIHPLYRRLLCAAAAGAIATLGGCAVSGDAPASHPGHPIPGAHGHGHVQAAQDTRMLVRFPEPMRIHTLENMRDHLLTLGRMQESLAAGNYDLAADLAESRLGMSSLKSHGAHDVARYMPQGMQDIGTAMHRSASQFAVVAKDASATGDLTAVLAAMARINQTCVACHAAYRLQ